MGEDKTVITNRQVYRDFHIEKTFEAGIELFGNEVKSLRAGKANLKGSFVSADKGELFILNMHINPYKFSREETDPLRPRKLLLHKAQIHHLEVKVSQQGYAIVPINVHFKRGYAKVEVGLGRGKKLYDKRHALKEKQIKRETEKALSRKHK